MAKMQWAKYTLLALYALVLLATPFISYEYKTRTLISISELIVRHKPFSRFVAGCAAWLLFLVLQGVQGNYGVVLSHLCWLSAHGILCFDADTHLTAHIGTLVLFIAFTLAIAIADDAGSAATHALTAASGAFLLLLGLNCAVLSWRFASMQNALELVWLGALCWRVFEF